MKKIKNKYSYVILLSILFTFILPILLKILKFINLYRVLYLFIILGILSIYIGYFIRKNGLKIYTIFILPVIYLISIFFFPIIGFVVFPKTYSVYFILFYLIVSFMALQGKNDDFDDQIIDSQIPVDGGIKDIDNG
jgi:hypothetical protein